MTAFLLWLVSFLNNPGAGVHGSECDSGDCGNSNGTQMTGLAVEVTGGIRMIKLSSGEVFSLR